MDNISLDIVLLALRLNGVLLLIIAYVSWQRRNTPSSAEFSALMITTAYWSWIYSMELSVEGAQNKIFLVQLMYVAIILVPVWWLLFAIGYTGVVTLKPSAKLGLWILPAISILMVWTNSSHGLFWSNLTLQSDGIITSIDTERSTWFWIHTAYSYVCLLVGAYLLLRSLWFGRSQLYLGQGIALALGVFAPWLANAAYIFELIPIRLLDPTPFGFTVTGIALSWAIYRFKFLDFMPAARDAILTSMSDGVVVLDVHNRIVEINPSAEAFLQEDNPENKSLIGADAIKVLTPWPHLITRFQNAQYAYATAVPFQFRNRTRYVDVRISPIKDGSGRITGRVLVTSDVTAQKITADLQKEKETAESSNKAKSAFLASMNHELRTPLNHIIGYSELVEEEIQANGHTDLYGDDLKKIRTSSKHLLDIITQILELAKLEASMVKLSPEIFLLNSVIEDVILKYQALAEKNGNKIKFQDEQPNLKVNADAAKVSQILQHVIHNAVRFTQNGKIDIQLDIKDKQALITVRDTGVGISAERLETIFKAFNNPESSARNKAEGLGLGLATTDQLCRLMNGSIEVDSKVGEGSAFTIHLPIGEI